MRTNFLTIIVFFSGIALYAQQTFTITASGFTFSPDVINARTGDMIEFSVGSMHPVLQVSESSFIANSKEELEGGFSFPSGTGNFTVSEPGTLFYVCKNHVSSGMKGKIVVSQTTGISEEPSKAGFEIFPNPVNDFLNIINRGGTKPLEITLFEISGKNVLKSDDYKSSDEIISVNVKNLRKGLYFVSVTYPDKTYTRKFLKL
jgi:plastocyanin